MQDFLPEHTPILKAAMRPRAPGCYFQPEDVAAAAAATGLNDAQIKKWAANTRARYTKEERETYLHVEDAAGRKETEQSSRVYRFFFTAFNVNKVFLNNFTMPKARNGGDFTIKFITAAIDPNNCTAEVFIEFLDQVWAHSLAKRLEELGAGSVCIDVFQSNDYHDSASNAIARIWDAAAKTTSYNIGKCTTTLFSLARLKFGVNRIIPLSSDELQSAVSGDFDVVKKRQRITSSHEDYEDDPQALADFTDFELQTLPALLSIHADDLQHRATEIDQFEDDVFSGKALPIGGVYFARSKAVRAMKIGATRAADAEARLYALSRCVPEPFQLVAWIPTRRPFRTEKKAHAHFNAQRIRTQGAGTEFFTINDADAISYAAKNAGIDE